MTDTLFGLVSAYGALVILASTFLSCLFLPVPSSLLMLAGGAFVATGDLDPAEVAGAAYLGAVAGDQIGYRIGRAGGSRVAGRLASSPARARLAGRARLMLDRHGGLGVFFSTWLFAPLGPWVNLLAGAGGLGALRFTLWDAAGEAVWVGLYVGAGYLFADRLEAAAQVIGNLSGALAAGAVTAGLGLWLRAALRAERRRAGADGRAPLEPRP